MKIIKETKYLTFKVEKEKPKTKVIGIYNKSANDRIGTIEWYGPWRQYCFSAEWDIIWNNACLSDIILVINELMNEHKKYSKDEIKGYENGRKAYRKGKGRFFNDKYISKDIENRYDYCGAWLEGWDDEQKEDITINP